MSGIFKLDFVRFLAVGGGVTAIHVIVCLIVAGEFDFKPEVANFVGYTCAVMVSYLGHSFYTFDSKNAHTFQVPRFAFLSLMGLLVSSLITYVVCTTLGKSLFTAMVITTFTVPLVTYIGAKFWVFSKSEHQGK